MTTIKKIQTFCTSQPYKVYNVYLFEEQEVTVRESCMSQTWDKKPLQMPAEVVEIDGQPSRSKDRTLVERIIAARKRK